MTGYDLLLKGGRVIDPGQGLDGHADVAFRDGRVAAVGPGIPSRATKAAIDVKGKLVVPGLVDIHTHVFPGVTPGLSVEVHRDHLAKGTTTLLDAGSAGAYTIDGFRRYVVEPAQARILALLNVSAVGMLCANRAVTELGWLPLVDVDAAVNAVAANRDLVVGLKVRMSGYIVQDNGLAPLHLALDIAERTGLPLMVHIGGTSMPLREILDLLRPNDILTHTYTAFAGFEWPTGHAAPVPRFEPRGDDGPTILDGEGHVIPEAWAARERGVLMDIGHGGGSFSFDVFGAATQQGFWPDTMGTDLNQSSLNGPVYDLPSLMARFLSLGMTLSQVIEASAYRPAQWLGLAHEVGTLRPGAAGDVAVLELEEGRFEYRDAVGRSIIGAHRLTPYLTLRAGRPVMADRAPSDSAAGPE